MYPQRIVCLTEEPTEVLYAIGEQDRIVGVSGFTVRPARVRKEKPRVSAFTSASIDKILALKPDLAIGFSDIQADIARDLIRHGVEVWISNHRTVAGIFSYIRRLGALVGAVEKTEIYARQLEARLAALGQAGRQLPQHPRVYFEEWDQPMISGIHWVSQLVEIAGASMSFRNGHPVRWPRIASWPTRKRWCVEIPTSCSAPGVANAFGPSACVNAPGWQAMPAVRDNELHEIKSPLILQPGPAALTDGVEAMHRIFARWAQRATA